MCGCLVGASYIHVYRTIYGLSLGKVIEIYTHKLWKFIHTFDN